MSKPEIKCSFCDKNQYNVKKMIAGPAHFICDECVMACDVVLKEEKAKQRK